MSDDAQTGVSPRTLGRRIQMEHGLAAARRNVDLIPGKPFDRIHICGKPGDNARIEMARDARTGKVLRAWARGFLECGLAWICPECGVRASYREEANLRDAAMGLATLDQPVEVAFMTLTLTHAEWRTLEELITTITKAFTVLMNSRLMRGLVEDGVLYGWTRALEFTYSVKPGSEGWHPHLHVLAYVTDYDRFQEAWDGPKDDPKKGIPYQWQRHLNRVSEVAGYKKIGCHPKRQDMRPATLDDITGALSGYLTKGRSNWDIAKEITRGDLKSAAQTSVTPQEMLLLTGTDPEMARLWQEYALATKGVHAVTWSKKIVDGRRVSLDEYLTRLYREHEVRQNSSGYVSKEDALKRQREEFGDAFDHDQEERTALRTQLDADELAREPIIDTALYLSREALQPEGWTRRFDPSSIRSLVDAVREEGAQGAHAYAKESGLPFTSRRPMRRAPGQRARRQALEEARAEYADRLEDYLYERLEVRYPDATDEELERWVEERLDYRLARYDRAHRDPNGLYANTSQEKAVEAMERREKQAKKYTLALQISRKTGEARIVREKRTKVLANQIDLTPEEVAKAYQSALERVELNEMSLWPSKEALHRYKAMRRSNGGG